MARTKNPDKSPHNLQKTGPSSVKHSNPYADPTKFLKMNFLAERGFNTDKAPDAFKATVTALGWEKFIKHRGSYVVPLVREFYQGISPPKDGIPQTHSVVRGEIVDFSPSAINEFYLLRYSGKAMERKMGNWSSAEMEEVRERICAEGATWEKFGSEFKMKKQFLVDEASVWFTFIRHSLMPTSHTTSVPKDRLIVLDAILKGESIDVGRIISKEIEKSRTKSDGYLYFPCLITELCKCAGVETVVQDERRTPLGAIPAVFKPRQKNAAVASDAIALDQLKKNQQLLCRFVKAKFEWEKAVLEKLSRGKELVEPPVFPEGLIEEEVVKDAPQEPKKAKKEKRKEVSEESLNVEELETSSAESESESEEESSIADSSEEEESEEGSKKDEVQPGTEPSPTRATSPTMPSPPAATQPTTVAPQSPAQQNSEPAPIPEDTNPPHYQDEVPVVAADAVASDAVTPPVQQSPPKKTTAEPRAPRLKSWAKRDPRTKRQQLAATEEEAMAESPEREVEKEPSKTRLRVKHVAQKRKITEAATMKDAGEEPSVQGQEAMEEIAEEPEAEAVNSDAIAPEQEKQEKKKVVRKRKGEGSAQPRRVSARVRASVSKR